jgi:beta-carotene/zeaxanthin 4-ketolase
VADSLHPRFWNLKGIAAAALIIGTWAILLVFLLSLSSPFGWWTPLAVAAQTFLYTGLFITAHDAMHGTISPASPRINRALGALAVALYALFSFKKLQRAHRAHHRHPASADDPDFHDGHNDRFHRWYLRFMGHYLSPVQILGMAAIFNILLYLVGVNLANLILFWVVPALLSTIQLFYFGTVLPHRQPRQGYGDEHRAQSNDFGPLLSFLTCYHFGYHWEHHERPDLPWWALPRFRRRRLQSMRTQS